jgi:glycosyltransferase involved in cell wall biosynthesis
MDATSTHISLVVSTLGRRSELEELFRSLAAQDYKDFDVIVVDQNQDDRIKYLFDREWPFPLKRLHTPGARGLSRGRNAGWRIATGDIVVFPDDDCWYPASFLSSGLKLMSAYGADVLTGRAADETGRSINGRYATAAHRIDRSNVWISGIEWVMLFKRETLLAVDGFNESIGVGAGTPWQACEGQDIILRAMEKGFACRFDPAFVGHHAELNIVEPDRSMRSKGRSYGRGLGYVLHVHNYGNLSIASWVVRPIVKSMLSALSGKFKSSLYFMNVAFGRLEGYISANP